MNRSCIPLVASVAAVLLVGTLVAQEPAAVPPVAVAPPRPVAVRVQWGGGQPRAWSGTITLVDESGGTATEPAWRTLCTEPDAAAMVHADGRRLVVHQPRPVAVDGVEITVPDASGWRIVAALGPAGAAAAPAEIDVAVADLLAQEAAQPLDTDGNRITVRPAPGEQLRATITAADGRTDLAAFLPGERVRVAVEPLLPARPDGAGGVELRMRLKGQRDGAEVAARTASLVPVPSPRQDDSATAQRSVRFDAVTFELVLPAREGGWTLELEAVAGSGLGWSRTVAARSLPLATLAAQAPRPEAGEWRVAYELDPGSPRLHERLRRLPGVGLPNVALPQVPLPSLSRPTLPRLPQIPLPSVPLPHVPLPHVPSLSTMVPRLSGLLAAGHSRVEPHQLGPMLRLPPAEAVDLPAWEGIVVAGAQPAVPHVVEIEYPTDQDAAVAVAVLEVDATGNRVESRHAGGFEIRRPAPRDAARLGVHRFVFWPETRHPVVLLANRAASSSALVGHVRILAGPTRLPAATPATGRPVHAFLGDPALRDFGTERDVVARVEAVARAAEVLAAQGAAGAVVVVHREGAALWPSRPGREAPRWGSGAGDTGGPAADLLAATCRAFGREGLRLVPAIACDAPLPALEAALAEGGPAAAGIACVGRDGRPRRIGPLGTTHYNVLDPRVQRAVEDLVRELASRLRGEAAVEGLALVLPHDGWLHLPGVAWGLDDATFARFRAAAGIDEPSGGDDRFVARAALVEGSARERWLEWRAAEIARFHARLADVVAEHDGRWSLHVMPTTLCAAGPLAERLRPSLVGPVAGESVLREAGLDPVRSTAHRRIVFVMPHLHDGAGLDGRDTVAAGNAAAARAASAAARRGVVVLEERRPLDIRSMVPHGPFGSAAVDGPLRVAFAATGADAGRPLAETLAVADVEVVFDARLTQSLPAFRSADRAAIEALPAGPLTTLDGPAPPLVVRTTRGDATWVHVTNAAAAPVRAVLEVAGRPADVMDMATGAALEVRGTAVAVDLPAWGMRTLRLGGDVTVTAARGEYDPALAADVAERVADLARRRESLEQPEPIDVLDNPGFELVGAGGRTDPAQPTGWEIVEARRGAIAVGAAGGDQGLAASFSSTNGLATLRSNPFPPPTSGRVSVAARLRIAAGERQPPLRIALEGIRDDGEYYRFAAVGGLAGGRPLTAEWQQFVLQVDDLPESGLESLRVRFDLLGPGLVEIDDVRVFDLAFNETERVRLSRQISALQAAVEAGDVGGCIVALDGPWPRFLEDHVPVPEPPAAEPATATRPAAPQPAARTGMLDRVWRLWQ